MVTYFAGKRIRGTSAEMQPKFNDDFTSYSNTTSEVYNQSGTWAGAVTMYSGSITRNGIRVEAGSSAIGKVVRKVKGELSQTLSPTGTYKWTVRNNADTIVAETPTGDASTLPEATTEELTEFTFDVDRILVEGDRIQLEYSGGDASNTVNLSYNNTLPAMPSGFKRCTYNGTYTDTTTGTPYFVVDSTPVATSGDLAYPTNDTTNLRVNPTNDNTDWTVITTSPNNRLYHDLGYTISDTKWVLRFKLIISSYTANTNAVGKEFYYGLSSTTSNPQTADHDFIGGVIYDLNTTHKHRTLNGNGISLTSGTTTDFTHAISAETLYVEIKRTSDTGATVEFFSDSTFTTSVESQALTISAGVVIGLRYIYFGTSGGASNGTLIGTIDDIKFFDGVSTAPSITFQSGSTFEQTDTNKHYVFGSGTTPWTQV